jgi:two-component system sensor histidine kinase AlgZ
MAAAPPSSRADTPATADGPGVGVPVARVSDWARSSTIFDTLDAGAGAVAPGPARERERTRPAASAFAVCNAGVVLRTVVFVHAALAVAMGFGASGWSDWLLGTASAAAIALPATLLWLVVACLAQIPLARLTAAAQWAAAIALGAGCAGAVWPLWLGLDLAPAPRLGPVAPVLAGAMLAGAIFHWLRLRARMLLPATTTARLAELQSRIRPHFLFNTLNSAIALVRVDPARAEEVLEDLSELFRVALTESGRRVTLGEEVELARRYLAIETVRFGARLRVQWDVEAAVEAAEVPPLMLQPLVENAVKHGVEPAPEGGEIRIRARRKGDSAVITVTNTVDGASVPGHGIALRNVRERLRLLHDIAADLQAGPVSDREYRVRITLPMG